MVASIDSVLRAENTTKVVSQVVATSSELLEFFGMSYLVDEQSGATRNGPNTRPYGHRQAWWDVFNDVRTTSRMRAPGAAAATVKRNKVGQVTATIPRAHEKLFLPSEELHNYRRIGASPGEFDEMGVDYVRRQTQYLGRRAANWRVALLVGMMRDSLYVGFNGDDQYVSYTGTAATRINFQMPAGNLSKLDMLGAGDIIDASWDDVSTDIITHLTDINAAFQQLVGSKLEQIICGHTVWNKVTQNTSVRNRAGTAAPPVEIYGRETKRFDASGKPINSFRGRLTALPWIEWLITDEGVEIGAPGSETYTKHVEDNHAWFGPMPTNDMYEMLLGGEPVSEGFGRPAQNRIGLYTWSKIVDNPTGYELFMVDNTLPVIYVPKAQAYGEVIF